MRLKWGELPPVYDRGVDQGVLYLDGTAHPWNGLVAVDERDVGSVDTEHYFDGNRVHISQKLGDFEATISAYTYPDAFAEYNGYSERETYKRFGFSYRTEHSEGHQIHLVYNALVDDGDHAWVTESTSPNPSTFQWDIYGSSVPVPGASPASRLTITTPHDEGVLSALEDILYGSDTTEPRLPYPAELVDFYEAHMTLRITYNEDGSYTASGPDDYVQSLPDGRFQIMSPSLHFLNQDVFVVNSF